CPPSKATAAGLRVNLPHSFFKFLQNIHLSVFGYFDNLNAFMIIQVYHINAAGKGFHFLYQGNGKIVIGGFNNSPDILNPPITILPLPWYRKWKNRNRWI